MPVNRIKVRAVPGRIVRTAPNGGFIPSDRFVTVEHTHYIERLIRVHEDLEVEPETKPAAVKGQPETKE